MTLLSATAYFLLSLFAPAQISTSLSDSSRTDQLVITGIRPTPLIGSSDRQWVTLEGSGFTQETTLEFQTGDFRRKVEPGSRIRFSNPTELQAFVRFGGDADRWAVRTVEPDTSRAYPFYVASPTPSIHSVSKPVRVLDESGHDTGRWRITVAGDGFAFESWILVNGNRIQTKAIPSSDSPHAFVQDLIGTGTGTPRHGTRISVLTEGASESNSLYIGERSTWRVPWLAVLGMATLALVLLGFYFKSRRVRIDPPLLNSVDEVASKSKATPAASSPLPPARSPVWPSSPTERDQFERRLYDQARKDLEAGLASVSHLVETMQMSWADLSGKIKALYGEDVTIRDYLTHIKMTEAAALLDEGVSTARSVATRVGYRTASKFSKAFKAFHGVSPSRYKSRETLERNGLR